MNSMFYVWVFSHPTHTMRRYISGGFTKTDVGGGVGKWKTLSISFVLLLLWLPLLCRMERYFFGENFPTQPQDKFRINNWWSLKTVQAGEKERESEKQSWAREE